MPIAGKRSGKTREMLAWTYSHVHISNDKKERMGIADMAIRYGVRAISDQNRLEKNSRHGYTRWVVGKSDVDVLKELFPSETPYGAFSGHYSDARHKRSTGKSSVAVAEKKDTIDWENMPAVEIVKRLAVQEASVNGLNLEHLGKLAIVTGKRTVQATEGIDADVEIKLRNAGLVWFVPAVFTEKFRYAAIVRDKPNAETVRTSGDRYGNRKRVLYEGDIPDSVLDKAATALKCGINHLTVHSNQPFPVKLESVRHDPVLIGWQQPPVIEINSRRCICTSGKNYHGVVIAIWDPEKEIEILS